jgi:hypothetical protein
MAMNTIAKPVTPKPKSPRSGSPKPESSGRPTAAQAKSPPAAGNNPANLMAITKRGLL